MTVSEWARRVIASLEIHVVLLIGVAILFTHQDQYLAAGMVPLFWFLGAGFSTNRINVAVEQGIVPGAFRAVRERLKPDERVAVGDALFEFFTDGMSDSYIQERSAQLAPAESGDGPIDQKESPLSDTADEQT